ncbi:LAFE_0D06370g1_1 [Lachancea fermentati]|uniref:LAFE_0D06370g1_1 n=1 Tax=Lachancea fermentati TaxID=4955 RepID=A0A1G4MB82_LACFM|nr:LAFE_0D06370g1_1 [Lachancea fermentati]
MSDEFARQLEVQRRAFEAQFGSLEDMGFEDRTKRAGLENSESSGSGESGESSGSGESGEDDSGSEFEGFSDREDSSTKHDGAATATKPKDRAPRVIKFQGPADHYEAPSRREQRLLKSGRAPKLTLAETRAREAAVEGAEGDDGDDEDAEAQNLKHDVELQRFLAESHLLSALGGGAATASGADLTLETMDRVEYRDDALVGKARARTLEMRLRGLSATNGRERKLEKVPMNVRRGMVNKHQQRITKVEQEARDAGVVLARVRKGEFRKIDATYRKDLERRIGSSVRARDAERAARGRRERGLRVQSVGRSTRNGLVLSRAEIERVNGGSGGRKR